MKDGNSTYFQRAIPSQNEAITIRHGDQSIESESGEHLLTNGAFEATHVGLFQESLENLRVYTSPTDQQAANALLKQRNLIKLGEADNVLHYLLAPFCLTFDSHSLPESYMRLMR